MKSRPGWTRVITGIILFVVGLAITVITYSAASGGGTYIVSWGPMLGGAFLIIRGLMDVARGRGGPARQPGIPPYPGAPMAGYGQFPGGAAPGVAPNGGYPGNPMPGYGNSAPGTGYPAAGFAAPAYGNPGQPGYGAAAAPAPGMPAQQGPTPPNWYPDPQDAMTLRWWDGQAWTAQTQQRY